MKFLFVLILSALTSFGAASTTSSFFKDVEADALTLNEWNAGTIANGSTLTLVLGTNIVRASFSGATATIALPAVTITTNSYWIELFGTNSSGGSQIITIPSMIREDLDPVNPITKITNNASASFTVKFACSAGAWKKFWASGDALSFPTLPTFPAGAIVGDTDTQTLTGKTIDAASNVLKFKSYLKFAFPRRVDGAGCTLPNTNDFTLNTFMVPRFSGTAVSNVNFCRFATRVPADFDTAVVPRASLTVRLSAADTAAHIYNVGFADVANSAVSTATVGTWIKVDVASDASGASDDVESVSNVNLTGWNAGLTTGHWLVIELNRAGATDASTVASDLLELEIEYGATQ